MAAKKIGISRDLIIHPGETIADVLEDRGITQAELASRAGVSPAYVSNVIAGKKGISANFAMGLKYLRQRGMMPTGEKKEWNHLYFLL